MSAAWLKSAPLCEPIRSLSSDRGAQDSKLAPRIVFVTRYLPFPSTSGDLIYSGQLALLLDQLAGHLVIVCAPRPDMAPHVAAAATPKRLRILPALQAGGGIARYPFRMSPKSAIGFDSSANRKFLREYLGVYEPDIVAIDHIGSSWALNPFIAHKQRSARKPRLFYLAHNEEFTTRISIALNAKSPSNMLHYLDALKIRVQERRLLRESSLLSCITNADRARYMQQISVPSMVLPPVYDREVVKCRTIASNMPRRVVVVSNFIWSAKLINLEAFLSRAAPKLLFHGIEIEIVGRMSAKHLKYFRRRFPSVKILGEVDEVEPFLANARLGLLIDQAGGGFKFTMLNYVYNRLPVVALSCALTDQDLRRFCAVSGNWDELADNVIHLIDDIDRLNALHESAYVGLDSFLSSSGFAGLRNFGEGTQTEAQRAWDGLLEMA